MVGWLAWGLVIPEGVLKYTFARFGGLGACPVLMAGLIGRGVFAWLAWWCGVEEVVCLAW